MIQDFQKQLRSVRFEFVEQYSDEQIKHAHDVFRRIAKTAMRYVVSGEAAEAVVESAKSKHGTSLAGLQGSFASIWGMPFDYENEEEQHVWWDRGWRAYDDFERKFTKFLVDGISGLVSLNSTTSKSISVEKKQLLQDKIRARNADLREKVTDSTKTLASGIFRDVCEAASTYELQNLSATGVAELAIADNDKQFAVLTETLRSELLSGVFDHGGGWEPDRAAHRSKEVVGFFIRDIAGFLVQQIVELRTERIEQCSK